MNHRIGEKESVTQADVVAIAMALKSFNETHGPDPQAKAIVLTVEDDTATVTGGLFAKCAYGWMFTEYLVVPDSARSQGLGTQLMQQAEAIARAHGCHGAYLTTLAFQARSFYEKLGYTAFGELPDFPTGLAPHAFMSKRF